jgi:predicted component of type VI protein secretion system
MQKLVIFLVLFLLVTPLCLAKDYSVSGVTTDEISQLQHNMDIYTKDAFRESVQFGSSRNSTIKRILNYIVVISGKLKDLVSIISQEQPLGKDRVRDLNTREVDKFIDYVLMRMNSMSADLERKYDLSNDALMIHHIESTKGFFREAERLLGRLKDELVPAK